MKTSFHWILSTALLVGLAGGTASLRGEAESVLANRQGYERYVAVDNACGWPVLAALPSGQLALLIWPHPNHGLTEGAYECWTSDGEGRFWKRASAPVPNRPREARVWCAAGVTADGNLVAVVGAANNRFPAGFTLKPSQPRPTFPADTAWLDPVPAISRDGGQTWKQFPKIATISATNPKAYIPFGQIGTLADGTLGAMLYEGVVMGDCFFYVSHDGGATWTQRSRLAQKNNETAWIRLPSGDLYAAGRTPAVEATGFLEGQHLNGLRSTDQGATWKFERELSLGGGAPASLTVLPDSRLLLTYGVRCAGRWAIDARVAMDNAHVWSDPICVVDLEGATDQRTAENPSRDGGYPSTLVLADGTLLTAYYSRGMPQHSRYHIGMVRWHLPKERHL